MCARCARRYPATRHTRALRQVLEAARARPDVPGLSARFFEGVGDCVGKAELCALLGVKLRFREGEVSEVLGDCLEAFIAMDPPNVMEIARPVLMLTPDTRPVSVA